MVVESKELAAKQGGPDDAALRASVIETPEPSIGPTGSSGLLWYVGQVGEDIAPWGSNPKLRDRQLRAFYPTEMNFASALGVVASRNAAFSWALKGPPRAVRSMQDVLENANQGQGWLDLMMKVSIDLYTQDCGSFVEVVRDGDSPDAPLIGLNHLDSQRCYHTGSPKAPVVYQDALGAYHLLKWYQVVTLSEMPMPQEPYLGEWRYGLQLCALSRMLKACYIIKNINQYMEEKTGGRFNRAIHLIGGVPQRQVKDALAQQQEQANSMGLLRYIQPMVMSPTDPEAKIDVKTLELASLPEGWNEGESHKLFIGTLAMAFLEDYQTFAPLPGGNLGTSSQSKVLHLKSRGKGPALFMKAISHALNFKILPSSVEFGFEEQDSEAEQVRADVAKLRAEERSIRLLAGEITQEEARQLAVDVGDLPQELFDATAQPDATPIVTLGDESKPDSQISPGGVPAAPLPSAAPAPPVAAKEGDQTPRPFRFDFENYI